MLEPVCRGRPGAAVPQSHRRTDRRGWNDLPEGDEAALLEAVQAGPVSIGLEADQSGFQFYSSGVFSGNFCSVRAP